jgi:hypothetical protein
MGGAQLMRNKRYGYTNSGSGGKENDYSFPARLCSSGFVILSFGCLQVIYAHRLLLRAIIAPLD